MMMFPSMLIDAAEAVHMKTPPADSVDEGFDAEAFPHFHVFCNVQLCRPITWGEHWDNAKVIADIPEEQLRTVTLDDLICMGLHFKS